MGDGLRSRPVGDGQEIPGADSGGHLLTVLAGHRSKIQATEARTWSVRSIGPAPLWAIRRRSGSIRGLSSSRAAPFFDLANDFVDLICSRTDAKEIDR